LTDTRASGENGEPEVGSLADEAAKLFGALSGWAREQGAEVGHGLSGVAAQAAAAAHDLDEHLATGSAECTACPVCRVVHAVRALNPEVRAHLSTAVTSLAQAASALLSTQPAGSGGRSSRDGVERIDLDEDWVSGD
jgi:hypothetical protein